MSDENGKYENGVVDVEKLDFEKLGVPAEMVPAAKEKMLSFVNDYQRELKQHIAPPGTFNLPPLL